MSGTGDLHFDAALDEWRAGRRPNPRPIRRRKSKDAGRRKCLSPESECRLCGVRRHLERHHLVPRSQGGDDVDENLVPLCGPHHAGGLSMLAGCHRRITENEPAALELLRGRLWPEEEIYVAHRKGWAWLEQRYPSGA